MEQQATHMCGYSNISSADTSPNTCHKTSWEISQSSEQSMEWHSDVNDPHLNCREGVGSMEWQEGGGPQDNVSVLGPQNENYGNKDIEMEEEEEPQLADDDLTIDVFKIPHTFFI